jgi:hypothetical protein
MNALISGHLADTCAAPDAIRVEVHAGFSESSRIGNRVDTIDGHVERLDGRFARLDERTERIERKLGMVDA